LNWDAIGAVGETLGAIAVVVSLIYLALQIRQNSRIVKGTSVQAITQTIQTELRWSSDEGEAMLKILTDTDSLSPLEAFKIGEWATAAMWARQNEFIQYQQKLIDDDVWHGSRGILENTLAIPWMRTWWQAFDKSVFTEDFLTLVDEVIGEKIKFSYKDYLSTISSERSQK
jgi:hypothetical protein